MSYIDGAGGAFLTQGSDGKIYGSTQQGGQGLGTIFSLDAGIAPPAPQVTTLRPASAGPGTNVLLWGNFVLGATAVSFNGTPAAAFQVTSKNSVYAVVPLGATSGPITITTPNGSFKTTESFTVQ